MHRSPRSSQLHSASQQAQPRTRHAAPQQTNKQTNKPPARANRRVCVSRAVYRPGGPQQPHHLNMDDASANSPSSSARVHVLPLRHRLAPGAVRTAARIAAAALAHLCDGRRHLSKDLCARTPGRASRGCHESRPALSASPSATGCQRLRGIVAVHGRRLQPHRRDGRHPVLLGAALCHAHR